MVRYIYIYAYFLIYSILSGIFSNFRYYSDNERAASIASKTIAKRREEGIVGNNVLMASASEKLVYFARITRVKTLVCTIVNSLEKSQKPELKFRYFLCSLLAINISYIFPIFRCIA